MVFSQEITPDYLLEIAADILGTTKEDAIPKLYSLTIHRLLEEKQK